MTSPINGALMRLATRAETKDPAVLVATFVDVGPLFTLLSSRNHQVLYGRRGTGKTHAISYLGDYVRQRGEHAVYVDLRSIGSSNGIFNDHNISIQQRAARLLVDTLLEISAKIYKEILEFEKRDPETLVPALAALSELDDTITTVKIVGPVTREVATTLEQTDSESGGLKGSLSSNPSVALSLADEHKEKASTGVKRTESGNEEYAIHFGSIGQAFAKLIAALPGRRLWIALDEWSVIPMDLQPFLADFIRRCLLPVSGLIVKIAAIEQRSRFRANVRAGGYFGIELGADMQADIDFDDFMVFDNDATRAKEFFADLLYRHVKEYGDSEGVPQLAEITNSTEFVRDAFTQRNAFEELVRAAEGVPRDAINVLSLAAQKAVDERISVPVVRGAARRWYQRDKESAVAANVEAHRLLTWIHTEVIGKRRARACLVPQDEARDNDLLRFLFDARVLHVIRRGVSGGDTPGKRFDVYALDYGCYVDLVSTKAFPMGLFVDHSQDEAERDLEAEVPAGDYRAIRRAILDFGKFERMHRAAAPVR